MPTSRTLVTTSANAPYLTYLPCYLRQASAIGLPQTLFFELVSHHPARSTKRISRPSTHLSGDISRQRYLDVFTAFKFRLSASQHKRTTLPDRSILCGVQSNMTDIIAGQALPCLSVPSEKEKKYDRQLRLWAASGQAALESANVLLVNSGSGTIGVETLKNLVLPGRHHVTIPLWSRKGQLIELRYRKIHHRRRHYRD